MASDLRAGSKLYATKDGIQIYSAPFRDSDRRLKATETKNSYREWKAGDFIGTATGQYAVLGNSQLEQFVEVTIELGLWTKKEISILWYGVRKITVDNFRVNITGYLCVGENSFNYYPDNPAITTEIPKDYTPPPSNNNTMTYFVMGVIFVVVVAIFFGVRNGRI
ncbi:hypothetical protein [Runella limosa]|uniref:hypothetical protein n=1 Tax=Runella limosa TaxID=370978 RepID=UPI00048D7473|nr:hypothetical protein [Runella limosa]